MPEVTHTSTADPNFSVTRLATDWSKLCFSWIVNGRLSKLRGGQCTLGQCTFDWREEKVKESGAAPAEFVHVLGHVLGADKVRAGQCIHLSVQLF